MMQLELVATIVALAVLVASGAVVVASYRQSRTFWAALGAAAAVFVIRWLLADPSFVHASLHGPGLLEWPYNNPYQSFRGYGPVAPLLHGWLLHYVGADLTWIALLHQLCSSLALVPMAWLAGRLAGSKLAIVGVFVVAALHPVLVRIGASEDAHAFAVLMAWIGLAGVVEYADSGRKSRLVMATAALILMLHTRQIMLAVLPFPFMLAIALRSRSLLRDRWFVAAIGVSGLLLLLRMAAVGQNPDQTFHLQSLLVRFPSLAVLVAAVRHHPLFDVALYQPLFVPLWSIGAVALWRSSTLGRCFVLFFAAMFVSTAWLYEGRNVALMFRMPLLTVACVLAGVGFARLFAHAQQRWGEHASWIASPWTRSAAGALILSLPMLLPGWRIVDELRPLTHEYRIIQATATSSSSPLPERFVLVSNPGGELDRPSYMFPSHLLRAAGFDVIGHTTHDLVEREQLRREPLIFFRGTACYAYSLIELSNIPSLDFATIIRTIGEPAANHALPDDLIIPAQMRPECLTLLEGAEPLGELVRVPARPLDIPFVLYGVDELEMGFYRVTPAAVLEAAKLVPPSR